MISIPLLWGLVLSDKRPGDGFALLDRSSQPLPGRALWDIVLYVDKLKDFDQSLLLRRQRRSETFIKMGTQRPLDCPHQP